MIEVVRLLGLEASKVQGTTTSVRRPYGAEVFALLTGDHLVLGGATTAEFSIYTRDGALERIVRWSAVPAPISSTDRARFGEMQRAMTARPGGQIYELTRLDRLSLPDVKPVYSRFLVSDAGALWVQRYPDLPANFEGAGFLSLAPKAASGGSSMPPAA